jgi:hypothetical protein
MSRKVNWVYTIFAVLLIAAGGFGYGFFLAIIVGYVVIDETNLKERLITVPYKFSKSKS